LAWAKVGYRRHHSGAISDAEDTLGAFAMRTFRPQPDYGINCRAKRGDIAMRRSILPIFASLSLTLGAATVSAQVFKCSGTDGKILYSSAPCAIGSKQVGDLSSGPAQRTPLSPQALSEAPSIDDVTEVPLPRLDENAAGRILPGAVTHQQVEAMETGPIPKAIKGMSDSAQWLLGLVGLVIVWRVVKALGRGARTVSKAAAQGAVDVAPAAKHVAGRVGATATVRTKDFFAETRKCPHCAESIKKEAKVCRYCHRSIE
jgi:hypothetical protein